MEIDSTTENRLELAWKLILEQYFDFARTTSEKEGAGINIFRLLRENEAEGDNCKYYYVEKDGVAWKMLFETSPDGEKIEKIYDPTRMILMCVQVPDNNHDQESVGNMKLFDIDSRKEIDHTMIPERTIKMPEDEGLRQRKIN